MPRPYSLTLLPLLVAAACVSEDIGSDVDRRRGGLGSPAVSDPHESVSLERLIFEVPEPVYVDRELLLAEDYEDRADQEEEPEGDEHDYEIMEEEHVDEGLELMPEDYDQDYGEEFYEDIDPAYYDEDLGEEDYDSDWDEMDQSYDDGDQWDSEKIDTDMEMGPGGDDEDFDSTYDSENGVDFYTQDVTEGDGFEEVGPPLEATYEPIARRLRRIAPAEGKEVKEEQHLFPEKIDDKQGRNLQGCTMVKIMFKVDKFGRETTVSLTGNGLTQLQSRNEVGPYRTKTMQKCVGSGTYTLKLVDRDGICCKNGKGWYKMWVKGQLVVSGAYFIGSKTHTVRIGVNWQRSMSSRDKEWLNAHNSRRRKYNGGKGYVPLRWSRSLAVQSRSYAQRIANNCGALVHAQGNQYGENLAKNQGSGVWGQLYSADKVMKRWVDNEVNLRYPKNAHYTQVIWRASKYVGCGDGAKRRNGNQMCRVQVCRYARAGNCNVRNGNWRAEAFKDDTGCGPPCAPEGCYV